MILHSQFAVYDIYMEGQKIYSMQLMPGELLLQRFVPSYSWPLVLSFQLWTTATIKNEF